MATPTYKLPGCSPSFRTSQLPIRVLKTRKNLSRRSILILEPFTSSTELLLSIRAKVTQRWLQTNEPHYLNQYCSTGDKVQPPAHTRPSPLASLPSCPAAKTRFRSSMPGSTLKVIVLRRLEWRERSLYR